MSFLIKRTAPSARARFTPLPCRLDAVEAAAALLMKAAPLDEDTDVTWLVLPVYTTLAVFGKPI